jgi:hypothetical protein
MNRRITWANVRAILDILGVEDPARTRQLTIDTDQLTIEYTVDDLLGYRTDTVYITGDRSALNESQSGE